MNKYLRQTSCQQILSDQIIIIRVKLKLDQCEQINQRKKKAKQRRAAKEKEEDERRMIYVEMEVKQITAVLACVYIAHTITQNENKPTSILAHAYADV